MYDYLIYDFDGTISDTYPVFTKALLELLGRRGREADYSTTYSKLKVSVGHALRYYGLSDCNTEYHSIWKELALAEQQAFPEAPEILRFAIALGKKNYLYTHSGSIVYKLLEKMGIHDCFDFVLESTTYKFPRKPAPDALNFLVKTCGIDRRRALMIGDRDIDIEAAQAAGIAGCLFDPGGYYPDCKAEHYIKSLLDLKAITGG
ncbi:MAG TPA: HAD-IA family hydrolase [Clostridiales bacterium]|jgi:HAD superfamily hydrolase (TIGR01549 family)|nr:HAD-IA family hydrolase [Clostridiales bacterium]